MLQVKLKSNIKKIIKEVESGVASALHSFQLGMYTGMRLFEGDIIKKQMSVPISRKNYTFGLKRRTGTLVRSWFIEQKDDSSGFAIRLANDVEYAKYHEESEPGGLKTKRLFVRKTWDRRGHDFLSKGIASKFVNRVTR